MSETPETDRLVDRLFGDPLRETVGFHVTWGPRAHELTSEERAAVLNAALDDPGEPIADVDNHRRPD